MKIAGAVLIVGALVAGGVLLSDSVPSYFRNGDLLARAHERAELAIAANDVRTAEGELDTIASIKEVRSRRLNEIVMASGGMVLLGGIGFLLIRRGGRGGRGAAAHAA